MESKPSNVNTDIFERGRREGRRDVSTTNKIRRVAHFRILGYLFLPLFHLRVGESFADNTRSEFVRVFKNFIPLGWHGTIDVRGMLEM